MKQALVASLMFLGTVSSLSAANYTWNQEPGDTWQDWANPANWLVDGAAATAAPGAGDTIKQPIKTNGSTWKWDLGGGGYTVDSLSFVDNWGINDTYAFRNGSLTVSSQSQFLRRAKILVDEGATLSLYNAEFGVNWNDGNERVLVSVADSGTVEIHGNNFLPRCVEFNIQPGGTWLYGKDTTLRNCNKNMLWYIVNSGTAIFENGLCKFNGTWSAPWQIRQMAGEMVWGGPFKVQNNLYYQIELTGGKVSATGDVTFSYTPDLKNSFKFTDGADLDLDVADGKTLDLTPFTYAGAATLRKTGAGSLKLADVPTALSMHGGPVTFAANSQTAMTSLDIGEGQAFTVSVKNMAIDKLVAVDGSLTLAAGGLTVAAYEAATVAGTIALTKAAYAVGDVIISTPSAVLRAAVKAAAEKAEMNVEEDGEVLKVADSAYVFNSTTVTDLGEVSGWASGELPPEGAEVSIAGTGVKAIGTSDNLSRFKSISVSDGAELQVAGVATLPTITLNSTAQLTVAEGAEATLNELYTLLKDGADPLTTLPRIFVAAGATLTVPGGTTFKNCAVDLKGTLLETSAGTITFGSAVKNETSYFGLTMEGATLTAKSEGNGIRLAIAAPNAGGRVVAIAPVTIKDSVITYDASASNANAYQKDGFAFGVNNPSDQVVQIVVDNTALDFGAETTIAGGVNLVLKNNSVLCRRRFEEGDYDASLYNLRIQNRAVVTLMDGGEIRTGVTRVNGDETNGAVYVTPDETGFAGLEILKGGIGAWYKLNGQDKGAIRVADGFIDCWKSMWWGWGNRNHIFNKLTTVEIAEGTTMTFRGVTEKMWTNDHKLDFFVLEAPFSGAGDLFIVNTWPGKTMQPTICRGDNTCTGTLRVAPDDGTALARVHFADGANWAGTVEFNGNVDLAPADNAYKADAVAATFGKARLVTALPLRVRRAEDGTILNDKVTLTEGFVVEDGDEGVLELVPQDDFVLGSKDAIELGTFPAGAFAHVTVKCGNRTLKVTETPTEVEGIVTCTAKPASGFQIIIR